MISVYTSICGKKDQPIKQDWPVIVFEDAYDKFKDSRRNSRIHKILSHKYFDSEFTIYMDGNMKLLLSPEEIVSRYMGGVDMALFKHSRGCIYKEAIEVAKLGLDDVELIIEQAKHYEDMEYGKDKGLLQGGFIIRRNNKRTQDFNEFWWADYCRYSRRDQLSLMPAIERAGVVVNQIPGNWVINGSTATFLDIVEIREHSNFEGNFNQQK